MKKLLVVAALSTFVLAAVPAFAEGAAKPAAVPAMAKATTAAASKAEEKKVEGTEVKQEAKPAEATHKAAAKQVKQSKQ